MNTPDQNPAPQGWAAVQPLVLAHIAQMAPHQQTRSGGKLLIHAAARIAELESENGLLKASNETAAEHMARGREYSARLEAELDVLKISLMNSKALLREWLTYKVPDDRALEIIGAVRKWCET